MCRSSAARLGYFVGANQPRQETLATGPFRYVPNGQLVRRLCRENYAQHAADIRASQELNDNDVKGCPGRGELKATGA
jgi:hypothetical protein